MTAPLPSALDYPHPTPPAGGEVIEVAPGVLWLRMPLPFALDHINLWALADVVDGVAGWTLVDTGYGNEPTRSLWERHFAAALADRSVLRVVATHYHPDHLGNGAWLTQRFGCPLWMTQAEYLTGHAVCDARAGYGPAESARLFSAHGLPEEHVQSQLARGNAYRRGVPEIPTTYRRILPTDRLRIGGHEWEVIIGFGHSPEHAALHCTELGVLISGDMLLPRISTNVSVWPVDPDGNPLAQFLASLTRFEALPAGTLVLPSHGLPFRGIPMRVDQLRAHHEARLSELTAAAGQPQSAWDVVPVLFRRELDVQQRYFAMGEAVAHLNYLWHEGRLRRLRTPGQPWRFAQ